MADKPVIETLDEAQRYARAAVCPGCQKNGSLAAHETRKEGPNLGRLFVKCRHCGHFSWLTPASTRDVELEAAETGAGPCPKCGKSRRAARVKKEGANQGKIFLACADPACDSFQWASRAGEKPPDEEAKRAKKKRASEPGETSEAALLAAIAEDPCDDALRLVYADWLEEHGQPHRAELIRVQLSAAALTPDDPEHASIEQRVALIIQDRRAEWIEPLRPLADRVAYVRGFPEVTVSVASFLEHGDRLLKAAPCATWNFRIPSLADFQRLFGCRTLLKVRWLSVRLEQPEDYGLGSVGMRIIGQAPFVAKIVALNVSNMAAQQAGVQALASSRYLGGLRVLDLSRNNLAGSSVPILASSKNFARLTWLSLAENQVGDSDLRALCASSHLKELGWLDLSATAISDEGLSELAQSELLGRLRGLGLADCAISTLAVHRVKHAPHAAPELMIQR